MNEITKLLESGAKLTSRQIAVELKKTAKEVIGSLLELEKNRRVVQLNGFWYQAKWKERSTVGTINILKLIGEWRFISAPEIAFISGGRLSSITTQLAEHLENKEIIRYRKDGVYVYSLSPVISMS